MKYDEFDSGYLGKTPGRKKDKKRKNKTYESRDYQDERHARVNFKKFVESERFELDDDEEDLVNYKYR